MSFYLDNIAAVYSHATADQHDAGMDWYADAHRQAISMHEDAWVAAGVIAAYSPQTPWWRNVEMASDTLSGNLRTDTLGNSWRAAARIMAGEDPLEVLGGQKTNAFCDNIATAGISDRCTIDVHAYSIAHGTPIPAGDIRLGKRKYAEIAEAYAILADENNMFAPQMQAITWVVWRDIYFKKAARKGEHG